MSEQQKDPGGRPPIIETPEEFGAKSDEYIASCRDEDVPPTITGMALHLGFASRQSFYDYENRDGFSYVTKRARLLVEHAYEVRLHGNSATGAIFALKNMGWSDKQELEHTGAGGGPLAVSVTRTVVLPGNGDG